MLVRQPSDRWATRLRAPLLATTLAAAALAAAAACTAPPAGFRPLADARLPADAQTPAEPQAPDDAPPQPDAPPPPDAEALADAQAVLAGIRADAAALAPLVASPLAREFLAASAGLPAVPARAIWRTADRMRCWSQASLDALDPAERQALQGDGGAGLERVALDAEFYYTTRYGSPLAYARPLDIAAQAGLSDVSGRRVLDFGYGGIGQLRLLASLGADAVGIEVDPLLAALYSEPGDQGLVRGADGRYGRLSLVDGSFPAEPDVRAAVGGNFDLVISKNTLKNGYLHPARPVDPRRLVHLGVSEPEFVAAIADLLAPGGLFLIYNLCPAPAPEDQDYIPWADGRCPFPRDMLQAAGLQVIAFDQNDDGPARAIGHALGWDAGEGAMDLGRDLFGTYTLARRPARTSDPAPGSAAPAGR